MPSAVARRGRGTRRGTLWGATLGLTLAFVAGRTCAPEGPPPAPGSPALRQASALARDVDALEARLNAAQGWVAEGRRLQQRHEQVSALHCEAAVSQAALSTRLSQDAASRRHRRGSAVGLVASEAPPKLAQVQHETPGAAPERDEGRRIASPAPVH